MNIRELVAISTERLALAEEQLQTTNRMFRSNLVDRVDVLRAEDAVRAPPGEPSWSSNPGPGP